MRFLADQDVYAGTVDFLRGLGHDVLTATDLGKSRASDAESLHASEAEKRVLLTRDRDFGNLTVVQGLAAGVVYLRMLPSTQAAVHAELERLLSRYSEPELLNAFIVVEPARHRFRRLPKSEHDGGDT